jgi:hypothetical protein
MDKHDFQPGEAATSAIRASVAGFEKRRAATQRATMWQAPLYVLVLAIAVWLVAWAFNGVADRNEQWLSTPHIMLYVVAVIVALGLYHAAGAPLRRLRRDMRPELMPAVFGFIDGVRYAKGTPPLTYPDLPHAVVGEFDRESFDDIVSGRAGFAFELYEARFWQSGRTADTRFHGVVTVFELETPFPGLLVASRKTTAVMSFFGGLFGRDKLQPVVSGNAALDATYDFRTDNPEAATPLVEGRLAQALEWLAEEWPDEPARIALSGKDGFLLLPTSKNFFELPDVTVPLDFETHVRPMITDLGALLATAALVRKVGSAETA